MATTLVLDEFDVAADGNLSGRTPAPTGTVWSILASTAATAVLRVFSATDAMGPSTSENSVYIVASATPNPTGAEYTVKLTVRVPFTGTGSRHFGIAGRYTDTSNAGYAANLANGQSTAPANDRQFVKRIGGVNTVLAQTDAGEWTAGDVIELEITDATKRLLVNGVEVLSSTDNTITDVGVATFWMGNLYGGNHIRAEWRFDDYTVTEAGGTNHPRGLSSSIANSASVARAGVLGRAGSSTVAHAAALARTEALTRAASSSAAYTAAVARLAALQRPASSTVAHNATAERQGAYTRPLAASAAHTGTLARLAALTRFATASVAHAGAVARAVALGRTLASTVAHAAAVAAQQSGAGAYTRALASSIAHTAAVARSAALARALDATTPHGAAVARLAALGRSLAATQTHGAAVGRVVALRRNLATAVTHAATVARSIGAGTLPPGQVRRLDQLVRLVASLARRWTGPAQLARVAPNLGRREARPIVTRTLSSTGGHMALNYSAKDPASTVNLTIDLSPAMDTGETLASISTSVAAGGVTVVATSGTGTQRATLRVSGGTAGQRARIVVTATTSESQTLVNTMEFPIESL